MLWCYSKCSFSTFKKIQTEVTFKSVEEMNETDTIVVKYSVGFDVYLAK